MGWTNFTELPLSSREAATTGRPSPHAPSRRGRPMRAIAELPGRRTNRKTCVGPGGTSLKLKFPLKQTVWDFGRGSLPVKKHVGSPHV